MIKLLFLPCTLLALFRAGSPTLSASDFAKPIEASHQAAAWKGKPAIQADFVLRFGGAERFRGWMLITPSTSGIRLERADGAQLTYDGTNVWLSPSQAEWPRARFDVFTWAYFWAAPYKLSDPGAQLADTGKATLRGKEYDTAKLTFAQGTGDAPDDWYVLYRDPTSQQLFAMAYIVTFGNDKTKAEKEPHAIVYEKFANFDGIPVPVQWTFWNWSKENGLTGEALGEAILSNVTFPKLPADAFAKPANSKPVEMPK